MYFSFVFSALATCSVDHGCEYDCNIVSGNETCTCGKGFELNGDGLTCSGMYTTMPV